MSKQKQFNNRLNDLFADMGEDESPISDKGEVLSGWKWQCDAIGYYTACGPEVEDVLGYKASTFLGQLMTKYQLSAESSKDLMAAIGEGENTSIEIALNFKSKNGQLIPIRSKIFRQDTNSGDVSGWSGFSQMIQPDPETHPRYSPEKSTPLPTSEPISTASAVRRRSISESFGLALEEDQTISVSSPYSGAGKQSLKQHQTVSYPSAPGIEAALAVPIPMADKTIGLLEITDASPGREWSQDEQLLVEEVAEQLSLAMENARLFEETQISLNRTEALFEVSRVSIAFEDIEELIQSVTDTIAAVLPAHRTLALLCDFQKEEVTHFFESNAPPIPIEENTYDELMNGLTGWCLSERKPALSIKGSVDLRESDKARNARERSMDGSIIVVPMVYRDQVFGTLTAINSFDQPDFTQNDVDLLSAMSNQVATALANANSFQEEQRRRRIAATLSEIARVIGVSLELEQIAERLLAQLAKVFEFNSASLQIVEGNQRERIGRVSKEGRREDKNQSALLRPISEDPLIRSVVESKQPVLITDTYTHPLWEAFPETAHVRSWIAAPLLRDDTVIGLLILDHAIPNAYDEETSDLLSGIAAQAAVALNNARLYQQAQSRSTQLQTAAEVSRAASSILDPNPLIEQTVNLIRDRFDLYYVGVFLIDETGASTQEPGKWAVLRAGTGDAGRIQVERNHKLEVGGTSMIGQCIETAQPQISQQVKIEKQRFVNPLLPETRSELALPLISRGLVTGAMTIQSIQPSAFLEEDIAILQTMADQVANALQNASLFDQIQIRAEELAILNEMSRQLTATVDVEAITRNIYLFTSRLINTSTFFIALHDEKTDWVTFPLAIEDNQEVTISEHVESQGLTKYVLDNREPLLINENIEVWMQSQDLDFVPIGGDSDVQVAQSWLGVPMLAGDNVIGIINVQHNEPHYYSEQDVNLMVAIASQGAIAFQNASLFAETRQRTEDLALLNKMSAILSNALDIDLIVTTIFEYASKLMDTQNLFVALYDAEKDEVSFPLVIHRGSPIQTESRGLGEGMTAYMIRNRRTVLLNGDVLAQMGKMGIEMMALEDDAPPLSFVGAPMILGDQAIGVIALQSTNTPFLYEERQRDLLISIASQGAIAIQNANLFDETRQRSEELQLINRVVSRVAASLDLTESLQIIADEIGKATRAASTGVTLLNEERTALTIMADYITQPGIPSAVGLELPLDENPASQEIIEIRKSMVILDPQNSPLTQSIHEPMRQRGIETIVLFPLIVSGEVIGTFGIDIAEKNRTFTEGEINLVDTIVLQATTAIENARLFEQTQQQLADLTIIQETTTKLSETLNIEDVVNTVLAQTIQSVQADSGSLYLLQGDYLTRLGIHPQPEDGETTGEEIHLESLPLTKTVVETREPSISRTDDPSLQEHARIAFKEAGIAVNANIPMIGPEGIIGILTLNRFEPAQLFDSEEINLVSTLANQAAAALENARLYQELRETAEQLREIDILKSQFLANMSHELRTPLNSIIGFSRVIMKGIDGPITDLQQQDLSAIYNAGQHLLNMINDILDISKIEAGKMDLSFEDVELTSIIDSVLSTARGLIKDKSVKLITAVDDDLPIITADPTRIRQILLNLISNSAKFTDDGSITMTARKRVSQKGGQEIYLAVTDTGSGIAEENQHKLFVPFSQVDGSPTRKVEGTGLGLSITRLLIDLHGGEIGVISEIGEGSTFWFTLPLPESSAQPDKEGNLTVLAIDDDPQVINLYERYLKDAGYQVIAITDPHEALDKARQIKPYAITLDIVMSDLDGWKLLEDLKADPEIGRIPVVICSILTEYDKGMKLGAANYLTKPILEDDLVHSLNKLREEP